MKIAHVVDSMEMGGAEMLVSQLCRVQREQGHSPSVYAIAALGVLGKKLREEGFTVHAHLGRHLVDAAPNILRLFRELRPDVVHLHNPVPTIYAALPARLAGAGCIVSTRHSLVSPPHRWVQEMKYACAAQFCDWIVGICDSTKENLHRLHTIARRKILRIYNGVAPLPSDAEEEQPHRSGFTLLYVGRLQPVKNLALLLRGFRAAVASMPSLRLWIVGDGSERARLEALAGELGIREQVKFWGEQLQVAPFFFAADVFILSSRSEGLPVSLLQAFSIDLPAIVTDVGGMAEVVRLADAGLTVPADTAEMAEAILWLATHPEERGDLGRNAAEAYRTHFTLEAMADAYMEIYSQTRAVLTAREKKRVVAAVSGAGRPAVSRGQRGA